MRSEEKHQIRKRWRRKLDDRQIYLTLASFSLERCMCMCVSMHMYILTVACMSDRTRLGIHTTCTNRRARGPTLEQWDHHTATILQGQSVEGNLFLGARPCGAPMLKKDNRPLIYDLGSLVRSPSTFFLSPLYFSLSIFRSTIVSFFLLALSGDHLARTRGIRTREGHQRFSALILYAILFYWSQTIRLRSTPIKFFTMGFPTGA